MDSFRYALALGSLLGASGVLLYWVLIHGFISAWKRMGLGRAYPVILLAVTAYMVGMFRFRERFMALDFGTSYPLMALGAAIVLLSYGLLFALKRNFSVRMLSGTPELSPERHAVKLVTDGLLGRLRNPRYAQLTISLVGYALIANYLIGYIVVAGWMVGIFLVVLLEERELRARFGKEYEEYCARVPRFIPRLGRPGSSDAKG